MTVLDTTTGATLTEAEWLARRRSSLGASDTAAALGVSDFATPIDKWQEKVGLAPPVVETPAMYWGKKLEPIIRDEYEHRTGETLATQIFARHPEHEWLTATLDGLTRAGKVVEFKTASSFSREWGDEGDAVPLAYLIQLTQQMLVIGATEADLAVLIGGSDFRLYNVTLDPTLAQRVLAGARKFWRCVETRTPPDWGRLDARALAVLHPGCEGTVELDDDAAAAAQTYAQNTYEIKRLAKTNETLKAQVLAALGDAQFGRLPDGSRVKRHRIEVPESTQTVRAHVKHYWQFVKGGDE